MFYFDEINGKKILRSDILNAEHFFTTRESFIKTKEPEYIEITQNNRNEIKEFLNVKNIISPKQTHTSHIDVVSSEKIEYPDTDGLILTNKDYAVSLNFADCTPIILYDNKQNIGAIAHAGWRGTAGRISAKTVKKMIEEFGSKADNIIAVIGPAISLCCYNVGQEVFEKLKETGSDFEGLYEIRNGEIFVDLKEINNRQLEECGVKKIDICPYCTVCDNDMFFSYRKENGTTNRHSAILKLK